MKNADELIITFDRAWSDRPYLSVCRRITEGGRSGLTCVNHFRGKRAEELYHKLCCRAPENFNDRHPILDMVKRFFLAVLFIVVAKMGCWIFSVDPVWLLLSIFYWNTLKEV